MGDGGRERDGNLGVEMGILGGGDGDLGVKKGNWGWGSLPILPSKESSGREWRGIGIVGEPACCSVSMFFC